MLLGWSWGEDRDIEFNIYFDIRVHRTINIRYENHDIAIAMSSSLADPVLGSDWTCLFQK